MADPPNQSADFEPALEPPDPGRDQIVGRLIPGDHRMAIVAARFNEFIVDHLLGACVETWDQLGGAPDRLDVCRVPGAFELGVAARKLADTGRYAAVVCLGCVIRGETDHYDHVVNQAAQGVKDAGVLTGVPCVFGVLTCENLEQAIHRAGAKLGNAGRSAMTTAVEMADLMAQIDAG
ncbi:MAG: 6,7-dimethyl-8-ribityllumazine synthase [Planctomycetota bacterium]